MGARFRPLLGSRQSSTLKIRTSLVFSMALQMLPELVRPTSTTSAFSDKMALVSQTVADRPLGDVPRDEVQAQLERILASPQFRNSRRCQSLLKHVVEAACEGHPEALKERVIGATVFGREPAYDTNQDAVVRNAAAEVRKRLAQYYLEGSGHDEIRIELSPGSYLPEFHSPTPKGPAVPAPQPPAKRRSWLMIALAIVALVCGIGWLFELGRRMPTDLDKFWGPTLAAPGLVQMCVGQSSMRYLPQKPENLKGPLTTDLLIPMQDKFLYFGDAVCLSRLTAYLSSRGKAFQVRGARVTPYSELRGKAVVLVGAFNNPWTMRLTEGARFTLANDGEMVRGVRDRDRGSSLVWSIKRGDMGWIGEEDYAIVTRVFDPHTEQVVVAAGGIGHYGTMAAGDFLSVPGYFEEVLKAAPSDWAKKNIQIVLQTKIAEGTPGPPKVLATHFW